MDRRLTTIVAADLVGYSRLMAADEEGTLGRFQEVRAGIVQPGLDNAGARLVKTMGDGLLVEFPSPVVAVRAALDIQKAMLRHQQDQPEEQKLRFRFGINLGDVIIDGGDILGDGVNVAARLESLAPPGGICISRAVHEQLRGKIAATLTALGPQSVKNLPEPVEVWRVELDGVAAVALAAVNITDMPVIVILPFNNMSSDPDQTFLADGIVEDVTTELSRFRTLSVIARNSAFAYKDTHRDIREIALELGAQYVVEGSVRRGGDRLRITAQLIEAETGTHIWADRWDRTMTDLFELQDALTSAIVTGVEPELGANERNLARRKPTQSLTAWELCQRGYSKYTSFTGDHFADSFELFHQAIAADPKFALPHAYLARWYWSRVITGRSVDRPNDLQTGITHARGSIDLDERLEMGHICLGVLLVLSGRGQDARSALDTAEGLNPNNATLNFARALWCQFQPEPDPDAMDAAARKALRLSPKDPMAAAFHAAIGTASILRHFDVRDETFGKAYETASRYPNADFWMFMATAVHHAGCGRTDEATHYLQQAQARNPLLTLASWHALFATPVWPRVIAASEDALERLVSLGLPRE